MGLVGVIAKHISTSELDSAASGGIPPRLGGGEVGARGVERGIEGISPGRGHIEPSRPYHRAMRGEGFPAPEGDPLAPDEGHHDRMADLLAEIEQLQGSDEPEPEPRPWEESSRGGSLGRALRSEGHGGRMFSQPPGGGMGRSMRGVQVPDIPGSPEAPPWAREHADTGPSPLRGLESGSEEPEPPLPGPRGEGMVGVREPALRLQSDALSNLNLNALPPGFRAQLPKIARSMADRPTGTGHRRQE